MQWRCARQAVFDRLLKEVPVLVAVMPTLRHLSRRGPFQRPAENAAYNDCENTLIVFKNGKEIDRSTADTDRDSVALMLRKAL